MTTERSRQVLVVEDNAALARTIARFVKREGLTAYVAHSCAEALRVEERFPCAILDVDLPDGNGIDLGEALHEKGVIKKMIFFTATPIGALRSRAERLGVVINKSEGIAKLMLALDGCDEDTKPLHKGKSRT